MITVKPLFLVQGTLHITTSGGTTLRPVLRLVWADDEYSAKQKMKYEYDRTSWDGDTEYMVEVTSVEEAI